MPTTITLTRAGHCWRAYCPRWRYEVRAASPVTAAEIAFLALAHHDETFARRVGL